MEEVARLGTAYDLAFDNGGCSLLTIRGGSELRAVRVPDGEQLASVRYRNGSHVTGSPDGSRFVVLNTSGGGLILNGGSLAELARTSGAGIGEGSAAVFGPGGDAYVQSSWAGDLIVRDSTTGQVLHRERNREEMIVTLAASPAGRLFAYSVSRDEGETDVLYVRKWPFADHEPEVVLHFRSLALNIAAVALRDERTAAVIVGDQLRVYSVPAGEMLAERPFRYAGTDYGLEWAPGGGELAVVEQRGDDHVVARLTAELLDKDASVVPYACSVAFSPDGALLAIGSWESARIVRP